MKLIIQEKKTTREKKMNTRYRNNKKFSPLVKVLELFFRHPILVLTYKWEL
jgi:hypothetical protein